MKRRNFIQSCCYTVIGVPIMATVLQSCGGIYYATSSIKNDQLIVKKSEFWEIVKEKKKNRTFVMLNVEKSQFPICLYKIEENKYARY